MKALFIAACVLLVGCSAKAETVQASRTSLSRNYEHITFEGRYDQLLDYIGKEGARADVYHMDWSGNYPDAKQIPVLSPIGTGKKYLGLCHAYPWFTDAEGIQVVCVGTDSSGRALDPRIERLEYRNSIDKSLF
ncbi:MAG: hypothetical protein N4J56_004623 [Chroococcidiopsis sp. SAG 2025]|uniref:hypothetical protein n=1 Tax=Chroococcidiopsis sp. SAG 2025 TaxID=171389 RepID=UPI00293748D4|nr:hypothetical protein [Chroococcidiopsis sp. SAG 2025]MDV2994969.1 hypothetical protein [Chroococcidiopsis sp. SAG 2025]